MQAGEIGPEGSVFFNKGDCCCTTSGTTGDLPASLIVLTCPGEALAKNPAHLVAGVSSVESAVGRLLDQLVMHYCFVVDIVGERGCYHCHGRDRARRARVGRRVVCGSM